MIDKENRKFDTAYIQLFTEKKCESKELPIKLEKSELLAIKYKKNWIKSIPRILFSFVILLIPFAIIIQTVFISNRHVIFFTVPAIILFVFLMATFIRPTVDRNTQLALRKFLRSYQKTTLEG
jgi:hypothetical protein